MGSDRPSRHCRSSRLSRLSRRAALAVAAAALCTTAALPAHAEEFDPGEDTASSAENPAVAPSTLTGTDTGTGTGTGTDSGAVPTPDDSMGAWQDDGSDDRLSDQPSGASSGSIKVTPSVVAAGAEVEIRVHGCQGDERGKAGKGGKDTKAMARSEVFEADAGLTSDGRGALSAQAKIRSTASPGTYKITSDCRIEGTLTVVSPPGGHPTAPVRAGGGGTADLAARAAAKKDRGPGLVHVVVAGGLAGGAGLAVAGMALHRRRADSAGD